MVDDFGFRVYDLRSRVKLLFEILWVKVSKLIVYGSREGGV